MADQSTLPPGIPAETSGDAAAFNRARLARALVLAGAGDRAAFQQVYESTAAKLFGICLRIFPERTDAEDALQDAFATIWTKAATFDPARASPITWLATVTRNRAIDRLRARAGRPMAPIEEASDIADPAMPVDQIIEQSDEARRLAGCLQQLQPRDAVMIRTAFFDGATYAELAARSGQPLGTVKSRIRRALLSLKGCLSE